MTTIWRRSTGVTGRKQDMLECVGGFLEGGRGECRYSLVKRYRT